MVAGRISNVIMRIVFVLCFFLLIIPFAILSMYLLLSTMALGWPLPRIIIYLLCLFLAEIISLVSYFKWPWVAVVVSWLDLTMIVSGVVPWAEKSVHGFFHQFSFSLLFLGAAHIGFISHAFLNRTKKNLATQPVSS